MIVYIKDSIMIINNSFENKLFIYDRISKEQFDINDETFKCLKNIKANKYDINKINELFDEDFIKQLFDLGIITFEKQKNINNIKKLTKFNNVRLFVELTNKCNLCCKHCYGSFAINNNDTLDIEKLKKVIHDASVHNSYQLDLTGGEPFLYPYLEEILEVAYNEGMIVRIFSNLTMLNEKTLFLLKKYGVKEIVTSIDSCIKEKHEQFRGRNGCFNKTLDAIKILKANNIPVSVNTMVGNHNKDEIEELVSFIDNLKVKSVLDVIVPEGRGNDLNENIYESAKLIRNIYENHYKIIDKNAISVNCGIGNRFIYIKSNGNIYICPSLIEEQYKIGHINNFSTYKIWELMNKKFSYLECSKKCDKCKKCNGGCRARALKLNGNICSQDDVYCIVNGIGDNYD